MSAVTSHSPADFASPAEAGSIEVSTSPAKRVTIICNDADYFLRHRRIMADALAKEGHAVRVATGGSAIKPELRGGWDYVHVPIERFAFRVKQDMALFFSTFADMLRHRPDSVHLITLKPIVVSGLAALLARLVSGRPTRIVATVPGLGRLMSPGSHMAGRKAKFSRSGIKRVIKLLSRQRDVFFTFETAADHASWLAKGLVRPENSFVISGAGVDPAWFYPAERKAAPEKLRVLFASRLLKAKGLDAFLEAARAFKGRGDIEFLVAGMVEPHDPDGYAPEELARDPAITFLGERADMAELLRDVDVVCLPTRYGEGIPRILIEAAATGLACIASNHDGCCEIVEHGETGVIVPERPVGETARAIAAAVEAYAGDPKLLRRHGDAGHAKFLAGEFAQDKVLARFLDLIVGKRH